MLATGVTDPRQAVMCMQDRWEDSVCTTRTWFEHGPNMREQVWAVLDEMRAEMNSGSIDGGCCYPMLRNYVVKLEAALEP